MRDERERGKIQNKKASVIKKEMMKKREERSMYERGGKRFIRIHAQELGRMEDKKGNVCT